MSNNSNNRHEILERNVGLLAIFIVFAISWGALVEITPLLFQKQTTEPVENLRAYTPLEWKVVIFISVKAVLFVTAR
ncbi:Cbb3-type cytochrome oxidase [Vibrio sp. B1FLJ16]|nr:Cbb3-type cytochrome oxidase [Vibrio sp. B1FLJ16]CAE6902445.1 Cbb3-type cytochrome oxidase [Vibrio sp. B1FLJ16]